MKKKLFVFLRPLTGLAAAALLLTACDPDKENTGPSAPTNVVYVVNEGTTNAAVSLYNKADKTVQRDLFAPANSNVPLGPFLQNMAVVDDKGYLVMNGADKVEVVQMHNFQRTATISGLQTPRYFTANGSSKAYVTEWQGAYPNYRAGRVSVVDLGSNTISKRIGVRVNPEQMLLLNNKLYVTNSYSDSLAVINAGTDVLESYIALPSGSKGIVRDAAGNIWVLCSEYGDPQDYLVRFNPATPTQQVRIAFDNDYQNGNLRTNEAGNKIYVSLGSGTYELTPTATALPATPLIRRNFYGLGIDPTDNTIYGGTASFSGDAKVYRYTSTGAVIDSFRVGVAPNSFLFR